MKRKLPWMKSAILSKRHSESKKQLPKKTVVPQVQHQFAEKTIVEPRGAPTPPVGPLEEETQTDLPALSLSCSSPLGTAVSSQPPPSLSSHLDLPTQYDGLSSPPFDLSPSASPSSPASAAASPTVIPSSSSTPNTTPTPSRRQHKLISQPTQIDLYLSQPSQDQSPPCDGGNRFSESDSLSCSPIELLDRATQLDCGSPIQKVPRTARSPRGSPRSATRSPRRRMASAQKTGAANSLTPTRGGLSAGSQAACVEQLLEEEDSLETSLLLLDTSTQDDALDALDYFQNEDGVYDSEREDDGDENGGGYECTNLISIKTRSENKKGSSPDRPTQDDRLSLSFSSQIDDMQADQLATRMKPESESLSSIPTQSDSFPLLGSAPTNIDDIPTQIDTNTTLTQIDSIPTQSDLPYECSQQHGKEKAKNTSTIIDAPTLADAFDIVDEPTPPLEGDFTGTPQLVQKKADARCKKGPGSDGKVSKTKRSNQKQQQKANSTKQKRNEENQSKSGTDHQTEGKFGKLVSLGEFESVPIPQGGLLMGRHPSCHPNCRFSKNSHISTKHCRVSVLQKSLHVPQGDESNDALSVDSPSEDAPLCKYGSACYRKNPQHHREFRHPTVYEIIVEDMSTNGTYINDELIGKGKKRTLMDRDVLSLVLPAANKAEATFDPIIYRYEKSIN